MTRQMTEAELLHGYRNVREPTADELASVRELVVPLAVPELAELAELRELTRRHSRAILELVEILELTR